MNMIFGTIVEYSKDDHFDPTPIRVNVIPMPLVVNCYYHCLSKSSLSNIWIKKHIIFPLSRHKCPLIPIVDTEMSC